MIKFVKIIIIKNLIFLEDNILSNLINKLDYNSYKFKKE